MTPRRCVECPVKGSGSPRKAPYPGPRCATHNRAIRSHRSTQTHNKRLENVYNITGAEYWAIFAAQGGYCAICQRASGARRRLSVDHDHACCDYTGSCGKCVRGLLCSTCNKMLGHLRDDQEAFDRAMQYLRFPPAHYIIPR